MYCVFFYFSISDLDKILYFLDELNKWFEKYFWIEYDWLAWSDTEKFLENRDWDWNRIYWVSKINDSWPHNMIKFWEDSFYISTEISWLDVEDLEESKKIEKLQKEFAFEMMQKLPVLWALSCFEECEDHISEIDSERNLEFSAFVYKRKNDEVKFFEWKVDALWVKK